MIYVRSLLFNVGFYLSLVIHILIAIPTFVLPRRALFMVANSWTHSTNWMLRIICNIEVEFRGLENLPKGLTVQETETLDEGKNIRLRIRADKDAPLARVSDVIVVGEARGDGKTRLECSPKLTLQVD